MTRTGTCTICTHQMPVTVRDEKTTRVRVMCPKCKEENVHFVAWGERTVAPGGGRMPAAAAPVVMELGTTRSEQSKD
jgi:phage FluMu protein Com